MKSHVTRLCLVFSLTLALLLVPSFPARAAATVELTSVDLSINGQEQAFGFSPDQSEYHISYTSSGPVEISVTAQAAAGCKLRIDNVPYADGHGSAAWSTAESCVINLQAYVGVRQQLYLIYLDIVPPEAPAPGGDTWNSENDPGSGSGPANGGQGAGNDDTPGDSGQDSGSDSTPGGGAPADPGPADADDEPEQTGADPADEEHTTHLILYIGAPFLFADGTYIQADTAPYLVTDENGGGYTMVPVRFIAEALGADVSWDGTARKVGIDLDGRHFELTIGQLVPGTPVAAVIRDSRTFVPLRYVMESFGAQVGWTQAERRIDIYYTPQARTK